MTNRQKNGVGCFVLAAICFGVAIRNALFLDTMPVNEPSGLGVSRLMGGLLPAMVLLILGVWLFRKPNRE